MHSYILKSSAPVPYFDQLGPNASVVSDAAARQRILELGEQILQPSADNPEGYSLPAKEGVDGLRSYIPRARAGSRKRLSGTSGQLSKLCARF
jgi:hypothetical protein